MTDLLQELYRLLNLTDAVFWAAALSFLRVGAMVALLPGLGETTVPPRVKLALAIAYALVIAPMVAEDLDANPMQPGLGSLAVEAVAGLLLGASLRLMLLALQTGAAIIAQATTLPQLLAGAGPEPQPAFGNMLTMAGIALALLAGLHVRAAELVLASYEFLPPGRLPDAAVAANWGLALVTRSFALAFSLASPFVIAGLIYNLAMGAINRAMPQLMVSMVGAPALTLGALALFAAATPDMLAVWLDAMRDVHASPFGVLK